ncbi:hypothetical protein BH20VER3_BH20VER3_20010 [soil metagenome]
MEFSAIDDSDYLAARLNAGRLWHIFIRMTNGVG